MGPNNSKQAAFRHAHPPSSKSSYEHKIQLQLYQMQCPSQRIITVANPALGKFPWQADSYLIWSPRHFYHLPVVGRGLAMA